MRERRHFSHLAFKTSHKVTVPGELDRKHFDRHLRSSRVSGARYTSLIPTAPNGDRIS
jgi:hypothetical protein